MADKHREGLMMMRGILEWLYAIKAEMDRNGFTFEEFIENYEKSLKMTEEKISQEEK